MVGVPGRSKACLTCRRRKKGCDFQRPSCTQCRQAGLECAGYERPRIFLNSTSGGGRGEDDSGTSDAGTNDKQKEKGSARNSKERHGPRMVTYSASMGDLVSRNDDTPQGNTVRTLLRPVEVSGSSDYFFNSAPSATGSDIVLPASLARTAYEERYVGIFWQAYLPHGRAFPPSAGRFSTGSWTGVVPDLVPRNGPLRQALLANCLAAIGKRDGQRWMQDEGLRLYVGALSATRDALQRFSSSLLPASGGGGSGKGSGSVAGAMTMYANVNEGMLVTLRMLKMFEVFHGADEADRLAQYFAWNGHTMGELSLFVSRRPEGYVKGVAHLLFRDGRINLIIPYMMTRKSCPLSQTEWKTIPWSKAPKTALDWLVDVLVELPGMMEALDDMNACPDGEIKQGLRQDLITTCWERDAELVAWSAALAAERAGCAPSSELRGDEEPSTEELAFAHTMILYWATCLHLYNILRAALFDYDYRLATKPLIAESEEGPGGGGSLLPPRTVLLPYCGRIVDLLPLFFNEKCGVFGPNVAIFPLATAMTFSMQAGGKGAPYMDRMRALFAASQGGEQIGKFLTSLKVFIPPRPAFVD